MESVEDNKIITKNIKNYLSNYKKELDTSLGLNIKKIEFLQTTIKSFLDYYNNLFDNISKEKNEEIQNQQMKSIKNELITFKSNNDNLFKNLVQNMEREFTERNQYLEKIIRFLEVKEKRNIKDEEEYLDINDFPSNTKLKFEENNKNNIPLIKSEPDISVISVISEISLDPSVTSLPQKYKSNRPINKFWTGPKGQVSCALCGISSDDNKNERKLGPLYGPFLGDKKINYVHEMCALYSPNIYIDKKSRKLTNVKYQIDKSKKYKCILCRRPGASIICCKKSCDKFYHYLCAKNEGCQFDNQSFNVNCPDHIENKIYNDDINSDIQCVVCKSGLDEDILILCSKCQNGYHIYCHTPELISVPDEDDWICRECKTKENF